MYLSFSVRNRGESRVNDVSIRHAIDDSYISLVDDNVYYNDRNTYGVINSGETDTPNYDYGLGLRVSDETPYGYTFSLSLILSDSEGNEWVTDYPMTVTQTSGDLEITSLTIQDSDSGNGDGILNRGETVYLSFSVRNRGESRVNDVSIRHAIDDSYISLVDDNVYYNDRNTYGVINSGETDTPNYDYGLGLRVSDETPYGYTFSLSLILSDSEGNEWVTDYPMTVTQTSGDLEITSLTIQDSDSGNGDGILNRGETVYLSFSVRNRGESRVNDVSIRHAIDDSYISLVDDNVYYNDRNTYGVINSGETDTPNYDYGLGLRVSDETPYGYTFSLSLILSDSEGNEWPITYPMTVQ